MFAVGESLLRDAICAGVFFNFFRVDGVNARCVQAEDLGAQRRRDLRIAVLRANSGAIWNVRNAWIWSCGEPYQIESVPHSTLSSPQYLISLPSACAACSGSRIRKRQVLPNSAYTLLFGLMPFSMQRTDQRVDAVARAASRRRPSRVAG